MIKVLKQEIHKIERKLHGHHITKRDKIIWQAQLDALYRVLKAARQTPLRLVTGDQNLDRQ